MKQLLIILLSACAIISTGCGPKGQKKSADQSASTEQAAPRARLTPEEATIIHAGDKAPHFKVKMTDGKTINTKKLRGKVVLVNFWATWCPGCREELSVVQEQLLDRFAGQDFVFIPISREEKRETVEGFLHDKGHKFAAGIDENREVYSKYASDYIPRNFVIDRNGNVALSGLGYEPGEFAEMVELIEKLLKTE